MKTLLESPTLLLALTLVSTTACGSDGASSDGASSSSTGGGESTAAASSGMTPSGTSSGDSSGTDVGESTAGESSAGDSSGEPEPSPYQAIVEAIPAAGAQMAVLEPDGALWVGFGGEGAQGVPMGAEHRLLIGSNTKPWTAVVTLMLIDEGALSLDDLASTWVEELDPTITVRDLLQHTSGMGEFLEHPSMRGHLGDAWTPSELIALGQEVRDDGPGPSVYSNANFMALGLILEAVEGMAYEDILQTRLLDPLGLEDSGIVSGPEAFPEGMVLGDGGTHGVVTPVHPSIGWAAGGGYSTAEDMVEFYRAVFGGELYGDVLLSEQLEGVPSDLGFGQPGVTEGYGLGLMVLAVGEQNVTGHLGQVTGFHSWGLRDDESGALVVALTNNSDITSVESVFQALAVAAAD